MFAELAAITSALGAINSAVSTFKEASANTQKEFLRTINVKRRARKRKVQAVATGVFLVAALMFISWGSYVVYDGYRETQKQSAIKKHKERQRQLRNMRQCGRLDCG